MDLYCIKEEKDLQLIQALSGLSGQYRLLPLMPKAALHLWQTEPHNVRLPIEFLTREERHAVREQAIDLSKTWHHKFKHLVQYHGIDLLDCCRLQLLGFFQDVIAAELMAPRLIAEYRPRRAFFPKRPSVPSFANTMHDGTADIFEAVLQWRFSQAGIEVIVAERESKAHLAYKKYRDYLSRKVKAVLSALRRRANPERDRSPFRLSLADLPLDRPIMCGYGGGYDLMVIWPYIKAMALQADGFPVLINASPGFDPHTIRSGLRADDDLRYVFVGDLPTASLEALDLQKARRTCLQSLKTGEVMPDLLRNPLLSFQVNFLFNELATQALRAAQQAKYFFGRHRLALYLDDYCVGPANSAWTEVANQAGIPTVTVSHGAVNQVEFFNFNAQWALSWGELGRQNWIMGSPGKADRVIVGGDPSMENIRQQYSGMGMDRRSTVVLMTGGFLQQAWTDMDLPGYLRTWEAMAQIARERPYLEFIIKSHPGARDLGDWYRAFFRNQALANVQVIDRQRLEDILPSAFFAVLMGKPGTAGLVAALARVPFVFLDTMLCREVPGYRIWCPENGVPVLTDCAALAAMIDRLFASREEWDKLLEKNFRFLPLYLTQFDPERVSKEIGLGK